MGTILRAVKILKTCVATPVYHAEDVELTGRTHDNRSGGYRMFKAGLADCKPFGGFFFSLSDPKPVDYLVDRWENVALIDPSVGLTNVEAFAQLQQDGGCKLADWRQEYTGGSIRLGCSF